jgi:flagellar protein FliS
MAIAASHRFAQEYQRSQIETSSPVRLVVMLYDGAIRFLTIAKEQMASGEIEERHLNLIRAQKIIGELISSLDMENGGEIAVNLRRLYAFMLQHLVEANLYDRQDQVEDVIKLLRDLRESWMAVDHGGKDARDEEAKVSAKSTPTAQIRTAQMSSLHAG